MQQKLFIYLFIFFVGNTIQDTVRRIDGFSRVMAQRRTRLTQMVRKLNVLIFILCFDRSWFLFAGETPLVRCGLSSKFFDHLLYKSVLLAF